MNHKRILSKSSLKSAPSLEKTTSSCDEVSRLQAEVNNLRQTVESLKVTVENRDAAIGTLAREKEKIFVELKSSQRTNRNLHQQLVDEREIHSKEKDYFIEEIKRLSQKETTHYTDINKNENEKPLEEEIKAKDEVIYSMGVRYLKLKLNKNLLKKKLEKIQNQSQKTCKRIILLLEENRNTIDHLLSRLITSATMTPSSRKYLELLQINAKLNFENTQLKVSISNDLLLQDSRDENRLKNPYEKFDEDEPYAVKKSVEKPKFAKSTLTELKSRPKQRSRSTKVNRNASCRHFMYIHEQLSPYFQRKLQCSKSDSCLIGIK